jgi:hypothetical protein
LSRSQLFFHFSDRAIKTQPAIIKLPNNAWELSLATGRNHGVRTAARALPFAAKSGTALRKLQRLRLNSPTVSKRKGAPQCGGAKEIQETFESQLTVQKPPRLRPQGRFSSPSPGGHQARARIDSHPARKGRQRQHLVCRRKSEQHLSKDQVEGSRFKCSLPHEQRTSNTGTNVRPYGVSEYRARRGKPCS